MRAGKNTHTHSNADKEERPGEDPKTHLAVQDPLMLQYRLSISSAVHLRFEGDLPLPGLSSQGWGVCVYVWEGGVQFKQTEKQLFPSGCQGAELPPHKTHTRIHTLV